MKGRVGVGERVGPFRLTSMAHASRPAAVQVLETGGSMRSMQYHIDSVSQPGPQRYCLPKRP